MVLKLTGNTLSKASAVYIENPVTKTWHKFEQSSWVYDGVADILLITTNFDLRQLDVAPLSIAQTPAQTGDVIIICGDPGNFDYDSVTLGYVRDANHMMKTSTSQITDCIFVNGGTIGGNSGSSILNKDLEVVGLLCFSRDNDNPTLGGGTNSIVINQSLPVLLTGVNNVVKKYLGLNWEYPKPWEIVELAESNPSLSPTIAGVQISAVGTSSPFYNILFSTDILLSARVYKANGELIGSYEFGYLYDMDTPGSLLYLYDAAYANINFIKRSTQTLMVDVRVNLNKTYADVNEIKDVFLNGGL
jgi:S1-C subfamily serine protease